jgi:hypothetical protein
MIPDNMEIVMVGGKGKRSLAKDTRNGLTAINKLGTLPSSWSTSSTIWLPEETSGTKNKSKVMTGYVMHAIIEIIFNRRMRLIEVSLLINAVSKEKQKTVSNQLVIAKNKNNVRPTGKRVDGDCAGGGTRIFEGR